MTARARKHAKELLNERVTAVWFGLTRNLDAWKLNTIFQYGEKWRKKKWKRVLRHLRRIDKPYYNCLIRELLEMKKKG